MAQPLAMGWAVADLLESSPRGMFVFLGQCLLQMVITTARHLYDTRTFGTVAADLAGDMVLLHRGQNVETSRVAARSSLSRQLVSFFERDLPVIIYTLFSLVGGAGDPGVVRRNLGVDLWRTATVLRTVFQTLGPTEFAAQPGNARPAGTGSGRGRTQRSAGSPAALLEPAAVAGQALRLACRQLRRHRFQPGPVPGRSDVAMGHTGRHVRRRPRCGHSLRRAVRRQPDERPAGRATARQAGRHHQTAASPRPRARGVAALVRESGEPKATRETTSCDGKQATPWELPEIDSDRAGRDGLDPRSGSVYSQSAFRQFSGDRSRPMSDADPSQWEADLLEQIRHGDAEAFVEYAELKRRPLQAFVKRKLSDSLKRKVEPEDIVQEAIIGAAGSFDQMDLSERDPFSWLCHLAERRIIDAHRRFLGRKNGQPEEKSGWTRRSAATNAAALSTCSPPA